MTDTTATRKHERPAQAHGKHEKGGRDRSGAKPFLILAIVLSATFMQLLDVSIVNVATFSIQKSLHASYSDVQLVLAGYQLAFACTLITGGRLGDIFGRRRTFLIGMAGFTLSSALCGAAVSPDMLTVSRVLQGAFSGLMFPQVLSVIQVVFEPKDRGKAFSAFGATLGLGTVLGPVVGGLLIQAALFTDPWRAIFFVNVPIGVVAFIAAFIYLPESKAPHASKLDVSGALIVAVGLGFLIYPLTVGRTDRWPLYEIAMLVASVPILLVFAVMQRNKTRRDASPLLDTGLFADRGFRVGALLSLVFFAGIPAFFFSFSLFLQAGHGFTAISAGLTTFSFSIGTAVLSARSDGIAKRLGRGVLLLGCACIALGMLAVIGTVHLTGLDPHIYDFIPSMVLCGVGLGLFVAPVSTLVLASVTPRRIGAASGSISTVQQLGGAIGVAVIGIVFFGLVGSDASKAVATEKPALTSGLAAIGVPAQYRPEILSGFEACYVGKAKAPDPTAQTATCSALAKKMLPGQTPAQHAQLAGFLQSQAIPGSNVTRRDFVDAVQLSLFYEVGIFSLAFLLVLGLPKVKLADGPPVPRGE